MEKAMSCRLLFRPLAISTVFSLFALALTGTSALANSNPFNAAEADNKELPMIASNETGKCGGSMTQEGKPGEAMQCGAGKCGSSMNMGDKPAAADTSSEGNKCGGNMSKDGKPSGQPMQCGAGKCGGK